jgi:glucose/arabinose dehydrogenase
MRSFVLPLLSACAVVAAVSCRKPQEEKDVPPSTTLSMASSTATPHQPAIATVTPEGPEHSQVMRPVVTYTGLDQPRSAHHETAGDRYLVANGKGFISALAPDGKVLDMRWIAGGAKGVTLKSPRGLTDFGGVLYVTDGDTLRMFDVKTGAPKGETRIPGAAALADVVAGPDGKLYVSDTKADAVFVVDEGVARALAKGSLGGPSGLVFDGDDLWVASNRSGEVYRLDAQGKKHDAYAVQHGALEGIARVPPYFYVTSGVDASIFRGLTATSGVTRGKLGPFVQVVPLGSPGGDLAFDRVRSRMLVPIADKNEVRVYELR